MSRINNEVMNKNSSPCHVTTAGENLIVVEEPAAAEIAGVARQLPGHAHRPVTVLQAETEEKRRPLTFRENVLLNLSVIFFV